MNKHFYKINVIILTAICLILMYNQDECYSCDNEGWIHSESHIDHTTREIRLYCEDKTVDLTDFGRVKFIDSRGNKIIVADMSNNQIDMIIRALKNEKRKRIKNKTLPDKFSLEDVINHSYKISSESSSFRFEPELKFTEEHLEYLNREPSSDVIIQQDGKQFVPSLLTLIQESKKHKKDKKK